MNTEKKGSEIFNISDNKSSVICPPEQVFQKKDFEYLLTIGGNLADNDDEYQKLMAILKNIGETDYYIVENIGATITERDTPFEALISVESSFKDFLYIVENFDGTPVDFFINHFFVFGKIQNWGIYICEYPTINIIGCTRDIKDKFQEAFKIEGNGFNELKEFIEQEFNSKPYYMQQFIGNYNLSD